LFGFLVVFFEIKNLNKLEIEYAFCKEALNRAREKDVELLNIDQTLITTLFQKL